MTDRLVTWTLGILAALLVALALYANANATVIADEPIEIGAVASPVSAPDPVAVLEAGQIEIFGQALYDAAKGGKWRLVMVLGLVGIVWAARRYGGRSWPWLQTDRGGVALVLAWGVVSVVGTYLVAGRTLTPWAVMDGLMAGATAAGGWTAVKRLLRAPGTT
jgi:hypothetical protein